MSDQSSREKIIKDTNKNILIKASAGSGKTTILVERIVALIEKGVPVSEIVAVTFTKKAANEFYERLYHKLELRIRPDYDKAKHDKYSLLPPPGEKEKEYDRTALKEIDNCFLGTMDSFVERVLNEHPLEALVPFSSEILSDEDLNLFLTQYYEDLHVDENIKDNIKEALYYFDTYSDKASFNKITYEFVSNHDFEFEIPKHDFIEITSIIKDKIRRLIKGLKIFKKYRDDLIIEPVLNNDAQRESYEFFSHNINQILKIKEDNLLDNVLFLFSSKSKLQNLAFNFTNEERMISDLDGFISKKQNRNKEFYNLSLYIKEVEELKYISSFTLPYLIKDDVVGTLNKMGKISFKEALYLVNSLLQKDDGKKIDIISHLKDKYIYFLIDESQDTDLNQYELFFRITNKENIKDFLNGTTSFGGQLFIVGDKKQSIYHFKGADISIYEKIHDSFLNKEKEGLDYEVIELTNNYRSDAKLCEYFNRAFNTFLKNQGYESIPTKPSNLDYAGAYLYDTTNKTNGEDIVSLVKSLIENKGYDYKDFMIIPYGKGKIAELAKAFSNAKIPYFSEGNISYDIDLIKSVISLFKYLVRPTLFNKYTLLRTSLFDVDITKAIDEKKEILFDSLLSINETKASKYLELLIQNEDVYSHLSLEGLDVLIGLIHLLFDLENEGSITTLTEAIKYLDIIINKNIVERFALIKREVNAIHLANVHKVKGLQQKIVILPFAGNKNPTSDHHLDLINKKYKIFNFTYEPRLGSFNGQSIKNPYLDENDEDIIYENEYLKDEKERLLYVAATRAEHLLFIPNCSKQKWDELKNDLNIPYFDFSSPVKNINKEIVEQRYFDNSFNKQKAIEQCLKSSYRIHNGSKVTYKKYEDDEPLDDFFTIFNEIKDENKFDNKLFGTLVHKLMEDILLRKENKLPKEITKYICEEYNALEYEKHLNNVYNTIYGGGYPNQDKDVPVDIYQEIKNHHSYAEVPYSYKEILNNKEIINYGIIDLVIEYDDYFLIVDYKTDEEEVDHSSQLEAYKLALNQINKNNKPIKTCIYHIKEEKRLTK